MRARVLLPLFAICLIAAQQPRPPVLYSPLKPKIDDVGTLPQSMPDKIKITYTAHKIISPTRLLVGTEKKAVTITGIVSVSSFGLFVLDGPPTDKLKQGQAIPLLGVYKMIGTYELSEFNKVPVLVPVPEK